MRPVIVGAGHNGLVAAFYLARAGLRPLVLERRDIVGGCGVTQEIAPGYRSSLAHATGPVRASVARDMQLTRRVEFVRPDPRLIALTVDGRALRFSPDVHRTAEAIRAFSTADADRYPEFAAALVRIGGFLGPMLEMTPPSLGEQSMTDWWKILSTGRRFRALGRRDGFRLLRWMPMSAADLVTEWFSVATSFTGSSRSTSSSVCDPSRLRAVPHACRRAVPLWCGHAPRRGNHGRGGPGRTPPGR